MSKLNKNQKNCNEAAELLKAIAHPLRLRIVAILCEHDEHVNGLAKRLGTNQSIVSQQLRILRMRGLVAATRRNGFSNYKLTEPHLRKMVSCLEDCLANRAKNEPEANGDTHK
ncbi:MAG: helix-turn-helix transcriptional regulator [Deltaproteobacteria bacterium]|nr:helix-turn-helix transcriptional regulator [Deltaproteobacteria bacterium]